MVELDNTNRFQAVFAYRWVKAGSINTYGVGWGKKKGLVCMGHNTTPDLSGIRSPFSFFFFLPSLTAIERKPP